MCPRDTKILKIPMAVPPVQPVCLCDDVKYVDGVDRRTIISTQNPSHLLWLWRRLYGMLLLCNSRSVIRRRGPNRWLVPLSARGNVVCVSSIWPRWGYCGERTLDGGLWFSSFSCVACSPAVGHYFKGDVECSTGFWNVCLAARAAKACWSML